MYGKVFSDMFTGSMMGTGALSFAVMGYVISNQIPNRDRTEFRVELRPKLMAVLIGEPEEDIQRKIDEFCGPDPESRSLERGDASGGRKLMKEGAFTYLVVNGAFYYGLQKLVDKREKDRVRQATLRAEQRGQVSPGGTPAVPQGTKVPNDAEPRAIYELYPRKVGKPAALRAIEKALAKLDFEVLQGKVAAFQAVWKGATAADLAFCPHPATWFNEARYDDDPSTWRKAGEKPSSAQPIPEDPLVFRIGKLSWRLLGPGPQRSEWGEGPGYDGGYEMVRTEWEKRRAELDKRRGKTGA